MKPHHSEKSWWLVILPFLILLNSWIVDLCVYQGMMHFFPAAPLTGRLYDPYIFWGNYDLVTRCLTPSLVALALLRCQYCLDGSETGKKLALWCGVVLAIGLECYLRYINAPWNQLFWFGRAPKITMWNYLCGPPYQRVFLPGMWGWALPYDLKVFYWTLRPIIAFAMTTAVMLVGFALVRDVRARRARGMNLLNV